MNLTMMDSFDNIFVADMNMSDRHSDIIFDPSIDYHKCMWGIWWWRNK